MSFLGRTPSNAPLTSADIPDGIIAAVDLAPNSVDSSELVDGSIDSSHLSSSLALTTPNLGTPSAGVVTNLSGVLPVGVTGGSGLTALGTVTAGNLSNTAIVYPTGHVIQSKLIKVTSGNVNKSGTTPTTPFAFHEITVTSGNTISFGFSCLMQTNVTTVGSTVAQHRYGDISMYHNTSAVGAGVHSPAGTNISEIQIGRYLVAGSSAHSWTSDAPFCFAAFLATQTTHYIGFTQKTDSTSATTTLYANSSRPLWLFYTEYKGNCLGTIT